MKISVAAIGLAGELEAGFEQAGALCRKTTAALAAAGVPVVDVGAVVYDTATKRAAAAALADCPFDVLLVCVATWSEDHHLLDLLAEYPVPVILHAFPAIDTGSLCGVHQICSVLTDIGYDRYHYVYGDAGSRQTITAIQEILQLAALDKSLKSSLIGSVGGRVKGMSEIIYDEFALKKQLGIRVVPIDESELQEARPPVGSKAVKDAWDAMREKFQSIQSGDQDNLDAVSYYLALKKLVAQYDLQGITVNCYPRYMGKICLGYSLLAEEGIVCGCEGDVNNTVMMKILYELSGSCVHNTDLLYPDPVGNTILFSHCGSGGISLAARREELVLAPVRLAGSGACCLFTAKQGPVMLANLVGHGGTLRMSVMTGKAVSCGMEFPGNPLKVRFAQPVLELCRQIAEKGTGHHWMAAYGDKTDLLAQCCQQARIGFNRIDRPDFP